jgi:hypothetical protein
VSSTPPPERDPFWTGAKMAFLGGALGCIAMVVVIVVGLIVVLVLIQFAMGFWAGLTGGS